MTDRYSVNEQLKRLGSDFRFWGRSEARELPKVLFPNEIIKHALNGRYEKGFALFCATDQRLLLLDKKPLILCLEDMRYEMVSEVDYTEQLLSATLTLQTPGRTLRFTSYRINKLRNLTNFIQEEVSHFRNMIPEEAGQAHPHELQQPYNAYFQNAGADYESGYRADQPFATYPRSTHQNVGMSAARRRVPKFTPPPPAEPSKT